VVKVQHYGKARADAGSLLALLCTQENRLCELKNERGALEFKLIPVLVALRRSVEKRGALVEGDEELGTAARSAKPGICSRPRIKASALAHRSP
jgi:hypothetical protein